MKTKTLNAEVNKGSQSMNYEEILEAKTKDGQTHKLRITIKRDSYEAQSYARVARFDGSEWRRICYLHYSNMETPTGLHHGQGGNQKGHFLADRRSLITKTSMILN